MNTEEAVYLEALKTVIETGFEVTDRTGVGTKFVPGMAFKFDLSGNKLPVMQTREIFWKNIFWEMIWIIRGETNISFLKARNVNIWNSWADKDGELGPVYGAQLRTWSGIDKFHSRRVGTDVFTGKMVDQLKTLVDGLNSNPTSRRHCFTLWNPAELEKMALPPCHADFFQFLIDSNNNLYASVTCRSTDMVLGAPVNIAEWSLFTHLIAKLTGFQAKEIMVTFNNPHVYLNHIDNAKIWLERSPVKPFPIVNIKKELESIKDLENLVIDDVELVGYDPEKPNIKFPVAV
jgi:thymidylate synthase